MGGAGGWDHCMTGLLGCGGRLRTSRTLVVVTPSTGGPPPVGYLDCCCCCPHAEDQEEMAVVVMVAWAMITPALRASRSYQTTPICVCVCVF